LWSKADIKERETKKGEGEKGQMFIRVSKNKFNKYNKGVVKGGSDLLIQFQHNCVHG
jgi:hypothetical protein